MARTTTAAAGVREVGGAPDIALKLGRAIVDGEFEAGARITEREVAERFDCSATTSREVFHLLEKQGAIALSARRGARIIDAAKAPPGDVLIVWDHLRRLLGEELRRSGASPPERELAGRGAASVRLESIENRLSELAELCGNARIGQVLARVALHVAIVAPERLGEIETSLAR